MTDKAPLPTMPRIRSAAEHGMESYRITHWPEPMPAGPGLPIRKALAAMSVGWVTRSFLERETRLGRDQVQALLDALAAQGALARSHDVPDISNHPPITVGAAARGLLGRISRGFVDATRSRFFLSAEDVPATTAPPTFPSLYTTLPMPRDTQPAP
jgi:hypothetical protein